MCIVIMLHSSRFVKVRPLKDFRRRFDEVELNRTSLYWGLLLICILSALVLAAEVKQALLFTTLSFSIHS